MRFDTQVARLLTNKHLSITSRKARCLHDVSMAALKKNRAVHPERAWRQCGTNHVANSRVVRTRAEVTPQEVAKRMRSNGFFANGLSVLDHLGVASKIVDGRRLTVAVAASRKNPEKEPVSQPPTASILHSVEGTTVHLDASASTDDGGIVAYDWYVFHDSSGSSLGTGVTVDYTMPATGTYNFQLTVRDEEGQLHQANQVVSYTIAEVP
jgi:hypothetical protein